MARESTDERRKWSPTFGIVTGGVLGFLLVAYIIAYRFLGIRETPMAGSSDVQYFFPEQYRPAIFIPAAWVELKVLRRQAVIAQVKNGLELPLSKERVATVYTVNP